MAAAVAAMAISCSGGGEPASDDWARGDRAIVMPPASSSGPAMASAVGKPGETPTYEIETGAEVIVLGPSRLGERWLTVHAPAEAAHSPVYEVPPAGLDLWIKRESLHRPR